MLPLDRQRHHRWLLTFALALCLTILLGMLVWLAVFSECAEAAPTPAPAWQATELAVPSVLSPGQKDGKYDVVVENVGGENSSGEFTVSVGIPAHLRVAEVRGEPIGAVCNEVPDEVICHFTETEIPGGFVVVQVVFEAPGEIGMLPSIIKSAVSVSGGGAAHPATAEAVIGRGEEKGETGPSGVSEFHMSATGANGESVTQAGGHPNFFTTQLLLNNMDPESVRPGGLVLPVEAVKDLAFYLPLGMLGDPAVTSSCPASLVETFPPGKSGCPASSHVGTVLPMILGQVFVNEPDPTHGYGLYSIVPEKGYAAEFAFAANNLTFFLYANIVRHDGEYVLRAAIPGIPGIAAFVGAVTTFYGNIEERSIVDGEERAFERGAFLTDPSNCEARGSALDASVAFNTWENPSPELPFGKSEPVFSKITGCGALNFSAGLSVAPETKQVDSPSGYAMRLHVTQSPNDDAGLGTPPVKDVRVTLPAGTSVSPSSANGLEACQESGPEGIDIEGPGSEEIAPDGLERPALGHCPKASEIGTAAAVTPLLREEGELKGKLFLAAPRCNPCSAGDAKDGKLFRLYLELTNERYGIVVKLEGTAYVNPETGQIEAVFEDNPQFPVGDLTVTTKSAPRAPLENSQTCGTARSSAVISPWSAERNPEIPSREHPEVTPESSFAVEGCPGGGAPFSPYLTAGSSSPLAGSTSPFTVLLKREDGEQNVAKLTTTLPEGLLANTTAVEECPEPAASVGTCSEGSQLGTATVAVGPGSDPYWVTGKVYFTGPYGGSPFGLSIVVPAVAGPFNLGNVIVRAKLSIEPKTAQATATNPQELPQMRDGVPLRIRTIDLNLTNKNFVLNSTHCAPASIAGTVTSTLGAEEHVSVPYAPAGCNNLPFKPVLSAATEAKSTKLGGTGVKVKIAYPAARQANVGKVVLSFPKKLPVREETLRQACRAVVFEANPAACPPASAVGTATVHTPILRQPLTGPTYLVSYGNAKFPSVVFVLQGEGVKIEVVGESFISEKGVLKVTFNSVPDAPFSTFETELPSGQFSQFTSINSVTRATASQCGENMLVSVTMTGQNGAQVSETPKMNVEGCKPSVKITHARATGTGLAVTVDTSVGGRLRLAGLGLKTVVRNNVSPGAHEIVLPLTATGRGLAHKHRKTTLTAQLVVGKHKADARRTIAL
jgi:hypothetical protein